MSLVVAAFVGIALQSSPVPSSPTDSVVPPAPEPGTGIETEFDWTVGSGETHFFSTDFQLLVDPVHGLVQEVVGGVVVVNDMTIEAGASVRVFGSHPLRILATGTVRIDGELDISGFPANNVQSLNLATVPQPGGLGAGGGGDGGVGSPLTSSSSPRGGPGDGPLGFVGFGGQGGESGYDGSNNRNHWRPGGGGGGAFGPDIVVPAPPGTSGGLPGTAAADGELGFDSTDPGFEDFVPPPTGAFGAETGIIPPRGGSSGHSVFQDRTARNDFWGVKVTPSGPAQGEIHQLLAGSGGGGGGDAIHSDTFPSPVFQDPNNNNLTTNDYKGGGGGGGGGGLHLVALDEIVFGPLAQVLSNGGGGGTGESTFFIDRVAGGGGGGSGGHIVFESGERIVFEDALADGMTALQALGAPGGLGLPVGENPEGTSEFNEIFDVLGYPVNQGGDGGPGVIQLHVPLPTDGAPDANIVLPAGMTLDDVSVPKAHVLLPIFLPSVNS